MVSVNSTSRAFAPRVECAGARECHRELRAALDGHDALTGERLDAQWDGTRVAAATSQLAVVACSVRNTLQYNDAH